MQMERRISAIEPHEDEPPSFDPLERSRNGWASLSAPGKSKVELSGNVVMGFAFLHFKASQDMSGILSCIAAHRSTSDVQYALYTILRHASYSVSKLTRVLPCVSWLL